DKGQLDLASQLISQVKAFDLPESAFEENSILPWDLELKILQDKQRKTANIAAAETQTDAAPNVVQQADYYPEMDQTRNVQVTGTANNNATESADPASNDARGKRLYDSGITALTNDDRQGALEYFRMAWQYRDQLNENTQQDLQSKLSTLSVTTTAANTPQEEIAGIDDDLRRAMSSEVIRQRSVAQRMLEQNNPRGALNHMRLVRDDIQTSDLDDPAKNQLVSVIEREIAEYERYIEQNSSLIENQERNERELQAVESQRQHQDDIERQVQAMLNDFNKLVDEERYAEAEIMARQARDIAPENIAVTVMFEKIRLQANYNDYEKIRQAKADTFIDAMNDADRASIADVSADNGMKFDENTWDRLSQMRKAPGLGDYMSERQRVIWSALKNQTIEAEFNRTPLSEAIAILAERAGVNMIPDTQALEMESVAIDTPISMSFSQPI
ncbi:MAG: hypothetical protein P8J33_00635, partial [Pirellulaceae bacterium]|nr:hypothetical protein [Pirellulaceae bacterium]